MYIKGSLIMDDLAYLLLLFFVGFLAFIGVPMIIILFMEGFEVILSKVQHASPSASGSSSVQTPLTKTETHTA